MGRFKLGPDNLLSIWSLPAVKVGQRPFLRRFQILTIQSTITKSLPAVKVRYSQQSQKAQQQSKLANVLFSAELARRLEGTGVGCSGQSPISSMNIVHISCPFSHFPIFPSFHYPTYFPIGNHKKSPNLCSVSTADISFPFR